VGSGAVVLAGLVPMVVGWRLPEPPAQPPAPTPEVIRDEIVRTPPGKLTVVDFVDFECPYCRMTHAALEPLLEARAGQVRVVRRQVPLPMHPHAHDAARAACCGEEQGKGEAMTNALFSAPVEELTPEGCEKLARSAGLSIDPYRACVADPKTDQRIEADRATFRAAGGYALPTIWIGVQELVGAQPADALQKVIDAARTRVGS
jgi:protein-disulfide isomerase